MANSRRSSEIGHSPSLRTSMRLSMQPDEEDDYDLEAMGMVSDGFRPQGMQQTSTPTPPPQHDRRPSTASTYSNSNPPPRPSSISKPKGLLASDNLALRHDGAMGPLSENSEGSASDPSYSVPARSMSMSSTGSSIMPQQETPYTGPTGPSHQYNMYPQQSSRLARTASVATTSTMQAPASVYNGPNGPTHPYGMYPQTTESDTELPAAPINPAGFPGLRNDYQRRIGPDGEEIAGIIGPDGHTEELPPYTQYPDEAYARKTGVVGGAVGGAVATPVAGPAIPADVANAGGIGLATRNPEFESRDSLATPQSRLSSRSLGSEVSSHHVNTAAAGESEKPQLKHWQVVAKRKICNIVPIWVVVLIVAMFCLMGIILGSVLGSLRPKRHKFDGNHGDDSYSSGSNTVYATVTTTFDASPLTTSLPSGFPALPTGVYNVGLGQDTAKNPGCIIESSELEAWSCNSVPTPLQVNITTNGNSENYMEINGSPQSVANTFSYGTQPPVISPQVLTLVTDNYDVSRGPAWFFQITYDKLVIIPSDSLYVPSSKKRNIPPTPGSFQRKQTAQAGDTPWFCYWNNTLLESFIYPNQSVTYSNSNGSSSSGYPQFSATSSSMPPSSTAQTNQRRQYTSTSSTSTWSSTSPSASPSSTSNPYFTPNLPKVMKLEERRIPEGDLAISPYCVQMQILDNGLASPIMNSTNQPVTIYINETEPTFASMSSKRSIMLYADEASLLAERSIEERQSATSCSCEWIASGY